MAKNRVPGVLAALAVLSTLRLALPPDLCSQACPDAGTIKPQATVQEAIKQISGDLTGLCAAVPSAPVVAAAPNAVPKATSGGTLDPSWTKHARVVVVDSAGGGDFTTLSAALTYVAAQSPSVLSPWVVLVMPGAPGVGADNSNYQEAGNLTVPIQTTVQGFGVGAGFSSSLNAIPTIKLACPAGTCLKLAGGASLANLLIQYKGAPTAAVTVAGIDNTSSGSSQASNLTNVEITVGPTNSSFVVDGLAEGPSGFGYLINSGITMMGGNAGNRAVVTNDTSAGRGVTIYGGRFTGATGCSQLMVNAAASGGGIQLFSVRIDQKCTTDLVNTGTGTFNVYATPFFSSSGTIAVFGPTFAQSGTSNPAACSPGQQFTNTTTPAHCDCISANTWKCSTLN